MDTTDAVAKEVQISSGMEMLKIIDEEKKTAAAGAESTAEAPAEQRSVFSKVVSTLVGAAVGAGLGALGASVKKSTLANVASAAENVLPQNVSTVLHTAAAMGSEEQDSTNRKSRIVKGAVGGAVLGGAGGFAGKSILAKRSEGKSHGDKVLEERANSQASEQAKSR